MSFKLIWSLKKRAYRLADDTPRVARRLDAFWLLDPTDWLDLQLLIGRPFEPRQLARMIELCHAYNVRHFIDCGANIGFYSVLLPLAMPQIERVDAFEPVSAVRWRLYANLGLNGLMARTHVHDVALSDRDGQAQISIDPSSTGISAVSPSDEERAHRGFARQETVRLARLDTHLPKITGPIAMKIDVEGHEAAVFAGMRETLTRVCTVVQIEARPRNRDRIERAFAECGYVRLDAINDDLFFAPGVGHASERAGQAPAATVPASP